MPISNRTNLQGRAAQILQRTPVRAGLLAVPLVAVLGYTYMSSPGSMGRSQFKSGMFSPSRAMAASLPATGHQILLPIEVMGPPGTVVNTQIDVPSGKSAAKSLRLQTHGVDYEGEASVKINDGAWIPLDNDHLDVAEPGKSYGGIGGPLTALTASASLPTGLVHSGSNKISFRFDKSDGVHSGYRILALNLVDGSGKDMIADNAFIQDDPEGWKSPLSAQADIDAGKNLWYNASLIDDDRTKGRIQATCSDCHATDGRDLKYFNYSNLSIEMRSEFHGLKPRQGQQIASYIRSLRFPNPGRPWNPPYQPGPGLDSKPTEEWAAGAGLSAVLADDSQMQPYMFPHGINAAAIATSGTLNMRELPISVQMLDWNHWLPTIHPKDAWKSDFTNSVVYDDYQKATAGGGVTPWTKKGDPGLPREKLRALFGRWLTEEYAYSATHLPSSDDAWTPTLAKEIYSTSLWHRVKTWDLLQTYKLEDYQIGPNDPSHEKRAWLDGSLFMTSPNRLKIPKSDRALSASDIDYEYLNNVWYALQITVNAGMRNRHGNDPVDWPYARARVKGLSAATHTPSGLRLTAVLIKGMQQGDNGIGPEKITSGWNPYNLGAFSNLVSPAFADSWVGESQEMKRQVLGAVVNSWLDKVSQYPPSAYYAAGYASASDVPTRNMNGGKWIDTVYNTIPYLEKEKVDPKTINRLRRWHMQMWPAAKMTIASDAQ